MFLQNDESILNTANTYSYGELSSLNLFNENLAENIINNRPYNDLETLHDSILYGFSSHFRQRILSILENPIERNIISQYIDKYPSTIRVLGYKNKKVLNEFKKKVSNENISYLCRV